MPSQSIDQPPMPAEITEEQAPDAVILFAQDPKNISDLIGIENGSPDHLTFALNAADEIKHCLGSSDLKQQRTALQSLIDRIIATESRLHVHLRKEFFLAKSATE